MNQEPVKKLVDSKDRISSLPVEILVQIIFLVPRVEITSTFTLSKHWFSSWKLVQERILSLSLTSEAPYFNYLENFTLEIDSSGILNDEMLHFALSKLPALKEFKLIGCHDVQNLNICCKKLKKLQISSCSKLISLGLTTPELVSFKYNGPDIRYIFENVPKLVEFSLIESYFYTLVEYNFLRIDLILGQLVKLHFGLVQPWKARFDNLRGIFPGVRELRLCADFWFSNPDNIWFFFHDLLQMAPNAEMVSMSLFWHDDHEVSRLMPKKFNADSLRSSFHEVKVFELNGYIGQGLEFEVILVLVKAAKRFLDKLVVRVGKISPDSRDDGDVDLLDAIQTEEGTKNARNEILESGLKPFLPETTDFEVLLLDLVDNNNTFLY